VRSEEYYFLAFDEVLLAVCPVGKPQNSRFFSRFGSDHENPSYEQDVSMSDETIAPQSASKRRRSGLVTAAGIMLVLSGCLGIVFVYQTNSAAIGAFASIVLAAGFLTVQRGRSWRIWAGIASWILIAWGAVFVCGLMRDPNVPFLTSLSEQFRTSAIPSILTVLLSCIGVFVLWAKRKEPPPDEYHHEIASKAISRLDDD
jgi:hypothetical protein